MSQIRTPRNPLRFLSLLWLVAMPVALGGCEETASRKPNVLLLLVDDLGYNDLGIQSDDPTIATPNMDQLARAGTRFTRFYTESTCSPSRAALLTGRYAARAGFRPTARGIPPELTTLPEALRDLGYATHHVGKWHLGATVAEAWPLAQGFDTSLGFLDQWSLRKPGPGHSLSYPTYYDPWLSLDNRPRKAFKGHLTDLLADRTIELIEAANAERPWFIYHAFFAPHTPIEPAARYSDRFPDTPAGKYKALLSQLDDSIGRILDRLRETGQYDNTIIVLASDNGGPNLARDNNYPYFGKKGTYFEGGVRVPLVIHWPKQFPPGTTFDEPVAIFDLYPTLLDLVSSRPVSTAFDGISLVKAQGQKDLLRRDLFWESYIFQHAVYGVLTRDNVRLVHGLDGEDHLLELSENPTGDPENAIKDPDRIDEVRGRYLDWRSETRRVNADWTQLGPRGRGVLRGDDFQRSPGMAGYTFAIGVVPAMPTDSLETPQIVAQQQGLLSISLDRKGRIAVEIDGRELHTKALLPGRCHAIVVSSFFNRRLSPNSHKNPRPTPISLYLNGVLADLVYSQETMPSVRNLGEPTYIGQDAEARFQFAGRLSAPRLYNQAMVAKGDASFPGVEGIQALVCPPMNRSDLDAS